MIIIGAKCFTLRRFKAKVHLALNAYGEFIIYDDEKNNWYNTYLFELNHVDDIIQVGLHFEKYKKLLVFK